VLSVLKKYVLNFSKVKKMVTKKFVPIDCPYCGYQRGVDSGDKIECGMCHKIVLGDARNEKT
jgi:ribosomal protein S27E